MSNDVSGDFFFLRFLHNVNSGAKNNRTSLRGRPLIDQFNLSLGIAVTLSSVLHLEQCRFFKFKACNLWLRLKYTGIGKCNLEADCRPDLIDQFNLSLDIAVTLSLISVTPWTVSIFKLSLNHVISDYIYIWNTQASEKAISITCPSWLSVPWLINSISRLVLQRLSHQCYILNSVDF